jgi:hypothetical protein
MLAANGVQFALTIELSSAVASIEISVLAKTTRGSKASSKPRLVIGRETIDAVAVAALHV